MTRIHLRTVAWFAFVAVAIAFAPYIPLLRNYSDKLAEHPQPYLGLLVAMSVIGIGLFLAVGIFTAFRSGRRMTDAEAKAYASASLRVPNYTLYRGYFRGKAIGQQVETGNSFRQIKDAFRSGEWLRDSAWRRFLLSLVSGMLWVYGALGIAFVLGPPAVKLIVGTVLLYVTLRLSWSMWRA